MRQSGTPPNSIANRGGVPVASGVVSRDSFAAIRRLEPADLKRCVALSIDRGWLPERSKWSLLLGVSEAFGVDAPDGRGLAGAVVLTRWGPDLASVGMMLVAARYGRRGLGRALMEHVIAEAGKATVTLFATDMGRPLYEKLGFLPVRRSVSFVGQFRPGPVGVGVGAPAGSAGYARAAVEADLPAILAVDHAAFGADRSHVLRRLPAFANRIAVLADHSDQSQHPQHPDHSDHPQHPDHSHHPRHPDHCPEHSIRGYAAAWRNTPSSTVIGPLVAPDAQAAEQLILDLAAHAHGSIRLDLDPDRPELPAWAHKHGLEPVSRTTVMARGDLPNRGAPDRLFTPISVALA
jgi:GNAT superfamily N-acetyltransferase